MLKGSGNIESIATQAVLAKKTNRAAKIRAYGSHPYENGMKTWDDILKS
jgi:hypothetical protein